MKGVFGIPFMAIIFVGGIIFIAIPFFAFKYHLDYNINYQYDFDTAQLSLLSLLSGYTWDEAAMANKAVMEILGEEVQIKKPDAAKLLDGKYGLLSKSLLGKCYQIQYGDKKVPDKIVCQTKFTRIASTPLPYHPEKLASKIMLVTDR